MAASNRRPRAATASARSHICIVDADLLHDDPRSFPKKDVTTTLLGGRASAALGNRKRGHEHTGQCCCTFAEQFNGGASDLEKQLT